MKKFTWIVALLAALTLVFVGCGGGGDDGDKDGPKDFTLVLDYNFQYAHGYQSEFDALDYFKGKITKGDEFTISFKVSASRDLEDDLAFGLVDPTPGAWTPYWGALSWDDENKAKMDIVGTKGDFLKAGVAVEVTEMEWTAFKSASSAGRDANHVVFGTNGQSSVGECSATCDWENTVHGSQQDSDKNKGLKGPVTLTFTDFKLKRKGAPNEGEEEPEVCDVCGEPVDDCTCMPADLIVGSTTVSAVKLEGDDTWGAAESYSYSFTIPADKYLVFEFTNPPTGSASTKATFINNDWSYQKEVVFLSDKTLYVCDMSGAPSTDGVNKFMIFCYNSKNYLKKNLVSIKFVAAKPDGAHELDM